MLSLGESGEPIGRSFCLEFATPLLADALLAFLRFLMQVFDDVLLVRSRVPLYHCGDVLATDIQHAFYLLRRK